MDVVWRLVYGPDGNELGTQLLQYSMSVSLCIVWPRPHDSSICREPFGVTLVVISAFRLFSA